MIIDAHLQNMHLCLHLFQNSCKFVFYAVYLQFVTLLIAGYSHLMQIVFHVQIQGQGAQKSIL